MESLVQSVADLVRETQRLARTAIAVYEPIVTTILEERYRDVRHIERTLDEMLGFCFDQDMLCLYRRLCRHLVEIDPAAAAFHVYAYRDMWDTEEDPT